VPFQNIGQDVCRILNAAIFQLTLFANVSLGSKEMEKLNAKVSFYRTKSSNAIYADGIATLL
jgi:hypothetical protein